MLIRRALLPALALALATCVAEPTTAPHQDGTLSLPVQLALIEGAADATALPINRIRAVVRGVSGRDAGSVLLDTRFTVDPSATSWEIDIEVPLVGASAEVVVQ
ncbi:MAG: hypothetical protein LC667_04395, partial [Thioalkalivibrio sp.]|nr:hypothetical protein [Thioalkalivibrio sp.]